MIGDQSDVFNRLKQLLPPSWFGSVSPLLDGVLSGYAWASSFVYSLYSYAKLQTRIKTATDGWLDLIAADYLGTTLQRAANQSDTSFRARILANILRERATRNGVIKVLEDLTGRTPVIFEPARPLDTGAYGTYTYAGNTGATMGYNVAGAYGSLMLPFQSFITAFRPVGSGIPNIAGYGVSMGAYSTPSQIEYASMDMIIQAVHDSDIYAAVDSVAPAGDILWTRIE
ncbi:MAG: hypothetical protein KGI54_13680 [Pseudomonadota bacterium]|nr:hypothetical protein [Pseudomonadota bacterium]